MFNVGPAELMIIGLVLLIAVGPEQLPGVIRRVGSAVGQARSMTEGLRSEFMAGLEEIERVADPEKWSEDDDAADDDAEPERPPFRPRDQLNAFGPVDRSDGADDDRANAESGTAPDAEAATANDTGSDGPPGAEVATANDTGSDGPPDAGPSAVPDDPALSEVAPSEPAAVESDVGGGESDRRRSINGSTTGGEAAYPTPADGDA